MGYVGSRMRRLEDPRLLAGVGHFADDEERPGQLWMRVVRSPVAHAVLGAVDVGDALKLSGVRTVLTGADISVPPIPVRVSPDPGDLSAYLQPVMTVGSLLPVAPSAAWLLHLRLASDDPRHKPSGYLTDRTGVGRFMLTYPNPSSLAMSIRWTSEVPSPISSTFASR